MGTRCLTIIYDETDTEICVLYRQMDGYPKDGHGDELKEFLKDMIVTKGVSLGGQPEKSANGMSCLAAQLIANFKTGVGSFYLYPAGTRDCGEEYIYTIRLEKKSGKLSLSAWDVYENKKASWR